MYPVTRISQTDAAVEQIKGFLLSDSIGVGDKLPTEKALCGTLQVGRSTVREALRVLQVMGYVKIHSGRGAFLASKHLDAAAPSLISWLDSNRVRVRDVVEVRLALETLAARLAVEQSGHEGIEEIDRRRQSFETSLENGEYEKLAKLDEEFHQGIVDASRNDLLIGINRMVSSAFLEYRIHSFRIKEHAANAIIPHRDITAAMRLRDGDLAQLLIRRHLEKVLADQESVVKKGESERFRPHSGERSQSQYRAS